MATETAQARHREPVVAVACSRVATPRRRGRVRICSIPVANFCVQPETEYMTRKSRTALKPFETGQLWELEASNVLIGQVGKLLVHYKHYRGKDPRGPTSLSAKTQLEKFLRENKAVLVQE
jgi:hypothetical protein